MRRRKLPPPGPPPPPSDYGVLLGSKLRALFRAPSGVYGNELLAQRWTDEAQQLVASRAWGAPRLETDGSNFARKRVLRLVDSPTTQFITPANNPPIVRAGEGFELACVLRATEVADFKPFAWVGTSAVNGQITIGTRTNQLWLYVALGGGSFGALTAPFTDTTSVHFVSGRADLEANRRYLNLDGVDIASNVGSAIPEDCSRFSIGDAFSSASAYVAIVAFINPPMTPAERAQFIAISRAEWGF
jgi:hypothetical protein